MELGELLRRTQTVCASGGGDSSLAALCLNITTLLQSSLSRAEDYLHHPPPPPPPLPNYPDYTNNFLPENDSSSVSSSQATFSFYNTSSNYTLGEDPYDAIFVAALSVVLGIVILITVIGNVFVIAAILLERNLQNVANYLIVSLAVADLMVACLVMPLGAVYEISRGWILGPELCDMWTSSDVLCCTASILHLVAIAVDRYWAVTNVDYIHTRNGGRIVTMIVVVWSVALVVSLAPQFGWKDPDYLDRINIQQRCLVSQDVAYQIFATCSTFYVPLLVILVLYWKIFQTARKRIRRRRNRAIETQRANQPQQQKLNFLSKHRFIKKSKVKKEESEKPSESVVLVEGHSSGEVEGEKTSVSGTEKAVSGSGGAATTAFTISPSNHQGGGETATVEIRTSGPGGPTPSNLSPDKNTLSVTVGHNGSAGLHVNKPKKHRETKKESIEAKRERKAAKTLAIITGAFVVCWLPFFIMALLMPLCESCYINDYLASLFLWLGYFNSTLNPVIYTIFSPEFRQAFKRMLCGVSNTSRTRR